MVNVKDIMGKVKGTAAQKTLPVICFNYGVVTGVRVYVGFVTGDEAVKSWVPGFNMSVSVLFIPIFAARL